MTSTNETASPANSSRKLAVAAALFVAAAVATIVTYQLRNGRDEAGSRNSQIKDTAVRVAQANTAGTATTTDQTATNTESTKTDGTTAGNFSDAQKSDIEKIIRAYLLKNPELMLEVQTALETKMQAEAAKKAKKAVSENAAMLFKRADAPAAGKVDGDVTVVEFFDYNCGYCKRGLSEITKLLDADKNVRVVFKELPILSKGSEEASRVALAAKAQNKYWDVHQALLKHRGQANKETALKIAEQAGLDMEKLKSDMDSEVVTKEITLVRQLADKMGVNGTPHFLVGDKSIPGAPDDLFEQLKGHIANIRKNGCDVC